MMDVCVCVCVGGGGGGGSLTRSKQQRQNEEDREGHSIPLGTRKSMGCTGTEHYTLALQGK